MSDEELLRSCLFGEVEEYHKIVERYRTKTLAIAMNILGNREDAEDASQDTFIQVYKNLDKVKNIFVAGPLENVPKKVRARFKYHLILKIPLNFDVNEIAKFIPYDFIIDIEPEKLN